MNTLTQLMQYFGYASAFAFVAPAIVLCSIARLGLAKGAPNINSGYYHARFALDCSRRRSVFSGHARRV